jgi:L-erythro-3,5-diaminohexanoate dehydrogenase
MEKGNKYGTHRVIEPPGVLPQPAWKIDNRPEIRDNEILIDVQTLNIDSSSFRQISEEAGGDIEKIKARLMEIVDTRGKLHNPVTGSGGMLTGTVEQVGEALAGSDLKPGDRIATLVSLSLTPLKIDRIKQVNPGNAHVEISGKAVLFESGIYARLPGDIDEALALSVLDVCGAPAQTARIVGPGDTVLLIGAGGKSGLLCLYEAKKRAGITGRVLALEYSDESCKRISDSGLADVLIKADARNSLEILERVNYLTGGKLADVVINNVNVPDTEMASILCCRDGGRIYFFSMATSFTKAALGAEGVGKDIDMLIGNGYTRGHAEIALQILRENPKLKNIFAEICGI